MEDTRRAKALAGAEQLNTAGRRVTCRDRARRCETGREKGDTHHSSTHIEQQSVSATASPAWLSMQGSSGRSFGFLHALAPTARSKRDSGRRHSKRERALAVARQQSPQDAPPLVKTHWLAARPGYFCHGRPEDNFNLASKSRVKKRAVSKHHVAHGTQGVIANAHTSPVFERKMG